MAQISQIAQRQVQQEVQQQAGELLAHLAGYVRVRTIDIGLRFSLLKAVASYPLEITAEALMEETGLDPSTLRSWRWGSTTPIHWRRIWTSSLWTRISLATSAVSPACWSSP